MDEINEDDLIDDGDEPILGNFHIEDENGEVIPPAPPGVLEEEDEDETDDDDKPHLEEDYGIMNH